MSGSGGKGGRGNKSTNIMRQNMMKQKMKEQELTTMNPIMNPLNTTLNSLNETLNPLNTKVGIKVQSNDVVSEEILMEDEVSFFFLCINPYMRTYIQYILTISFSHTIY